MYTLRVTARSNNSYGGSETCGMQRRALDLNRMLF